MTPLYKSIAADVELALGEVVSEECRRTSRASKHRRPARRISGFRCGGIQAWEASAEPRRLYHPRLVTSRRAPRVVRQAPQHNAAATGYAPGAQSITHCQC